VHYNDIVDPLTRLWMRFYNNMYNELSNTNMTFSTANG